MKARISAAFVDAAVLLEPLVLGGDERGPDVHRNLGERHPYAPLVLLEHLREFLPAAVQKLAGARQPHAAQPRMVGKVCDRAVVVFDDIGDVDRRILDRLVLAELLVGDVQVAEVHAAELGQPVGNRLRIVHRGGDQVVDIEVFDVERLAHVAAAGAQQLHDLMLVLDRIEFGLDRLGSDRHLAEREGGRENLDEKGFHRIATWRAGLRDT